MLNADDSTREMLRYNATHKVLICSKCRYAVQKNAIGSHLLRHKIYRGDRQRLLESIAKLDLLEPEDVCLPEAGGPPVEGLPVTEGYRCAADGCGVLYASSKRMRRHWSEGHGVREPSSDFAKKVNLQTFFRGTKNRYFEVASQDEAPPSSPQLETPPQSCQRLDMESLRYFHHFTTTTCDTLPTAGHEARTHWHEDVVKRALQVDWLMSGLLALSSAHVAELVASTTTTEIHLGYLSRQLRDFHQGYDPRLSAHTQLDDEDTQLGARLACIHRCIEQSLGNKAFGDILSCIETVAGCIGEKTVDISHDADETRAPILDHIPNDVVEPIQKLPFRIALMLGKPDNVSELRTTMDAVRLLSRYTVESYEPRRAWAGWNSMAGWAAGLSEHFKVMIENKSHVAFVVVTHWLVIVRRVENNCWFLRGTFRHLADLIIGSIPEDSGTGKLIATLLS